MNIDYTQDALTLSNTCPECIAQEQLCTDCVDAADARLTDKVYEAASEGNLQYKHQWFITTEPSGHEWTDRDDEFLPPIYHMEDGGVLDNVWEIEDQMQRSRETQCQWCHLLTPKMYNDCQSCDHPLESNVR